MTGRWGLGGVALRRRQLVLGGLPLLAACTLSPAENHEGPEVPQALPLPPGRPRRMAWVLSSGGPRGFVHVGVLCALAELGLQPDLVVGASAGALVGALYASGCAPRAIESMALGLQPWTLARYAVGGNERWSGSALADWVRGHARVPLLQDMPCAMACVAARARDGQVAAFTHGDVGLAVQASAAIEGQFVPVRLNGEAWLDADWTMPLPVRVARRLGATHVLAIDASASADRAPEEARARWGAQDRRKDALVAVDAALADFVLKPDIGYYAGMSRAYRERVIDAGYRATLAAGERLRALHAAASAAASTSGPTMAPALLPSGSAGIATGG